MCIPTWHIYHEGNIHLMVQNILYFNVKVLSAVLTCTCCSLWGGSSHSLSSTLEWKPFDVFPRWLCDCSEASSPSKAFLTSFEYLLKFWHHLSGTSSQNTCHGSFQSQIAFVPWHYHLFEARCVCVCVCVRACLFSSLKWLLFISLMDALC